MYTVHAVAAHCDGAKSSELEKMELKVSGCSCENGSEATLWYYLSLQTSLNCITLHFIALHFSIAALHYNMPLQVSLHSALYLAAAEHSSALKAELCWVLLRRNPRHVWKRRLADSTQPHIEFRNFSTAFNAHHCTTFPLVIVLNCIEVGEQN